jgi:F0F1-type ATP synthase membrane subunit a
MTVRVTKVLLPVLSIVLLAPFVVVAFVVLVVELYSVVVRPVSLSFRLFAGQASTSLLALPHPVTAVAILIGSGIIIFVAFRFAR